jgi:hypothetical protein
MAYSQSQWRNICKHLVIRNKSEIFTNEIGGNEENGIECIGKNNFTFIKNNPYIGLNRLAGIKCD